MQAMIRERDEKLAELSRLHSELDEERKKAEELKKQIELSQEMEQSERERLVSFCFFPFFL